MDCSRRHIVSAFLKEQRAAVSHGLSSDMKEISVAMPTSDYLLTSPVNFFSDFHTTTSRKMSAEDLFDGAIGIDLGTTYS